MSRSIGQSVIVSNYRSFKACELVLHFLVLQFLIHVGQKMKSRANDASNDGHRPPPSGETCPIPTTDASCPREETIKVLMKESKCYCCYCCCCYGYCCCCCCCCCYCCYFILTLQAIVTEETHAAPHLSHVRLDKETVTVTLNAFLVQLKLKKT